MTLCGHGRPPARWLPLRRLQYLDLPRQPRQARRRPRRYHQTHRSHESPGSWHPWHAAFHDLLPRFAPALDAEKTVAEVRTAMAGLLDGHYGAALLKCLSQLE